VDVVNAVSVTQEHKAILDYVAQETHNDNFENLADDQKNDVREDAKERHLAYCMLQNSGKQHGTLKMDLQNDFTMGDNHYPKTQQATLHLLYKYTKPAIQKQKEYEGSSFTTKGNETKGGNKNKNKGKGNNKKDYDREYWANKECYNCHGKGHPSYACPEKNKKDDDDSSTTSSINKLTKEIRGIKKQFRMINAKLDSLDEGSNMSGSKDKGTDSKLVMMEAYQFAQVEPQFDPRIQAILKQSEHPVHLDLHNVWLLDCQSTTDLACNKKFLTDT
jgi:hypothetical protein